MRGLANIGFRKRAGMVSAGVLLCLFCLDLVDSLAGPLDLSPEERSWLEDHPVIRFGSDPSWPPFSMRSGNELDGLDRDFIDLFAERIGVRFEYVPTASWEETLVRLQRGEIDFVSGITNLPERPLEILYTKPYAEFPVVMIMRTDGPFFTSLEQVEKDRLTLATPSGYAATVLIEKNHPGIKLVRTRTSLEALRKVSDGSADAAIQNLGVAAHLIRANGLGNLKITGSTLHHFKPSFGIREEFPELWGILEKALASITARERLRIYEKWILVEMSRLWSWRQVLLAGGILVGVALMLVVFVVRRNHRLGRELEKRQVEKDHSRQDEESFRHVFETMEDAYFLTRADGKIQFVNGAAVALLEVGSRSVVAGLGIETFLRRSGEFKHLLGLLRDEHRLRDHPVEFTKANGEFCACQCQIRMLRDPDGSDIGIEWMARPGRLIDYYPE